MSKKYQHLFFDLDHTLWDFDTNAKETLIELFDRYELAQHGLFEVQDFISLYTENNHELWRAYHLGEISKEELRDTRFKKTFRELGLPEALIPLQFEEDYVKESPHKTNLFAGAHEVLQALQPHYHMHIITNGFKESSDLKLSKSNLKPYFKEIFVSEVIGKYKPDIALFQHALAVAGCEAKDAIMIGDSLEADILGAKNAGIDQIFFNPHFQAHTVDCNYEISQLSELLGILA